MNEIQNTALIKIINESGLQLTEAETIKQSYLPFFDQLAEIKEQALKIDFENPKEIDETIARELRLKTVKIRTGSEIIKDEQKRMDLLRANLKQSTWNLIRDTCKMDEEKYMQVEKKREIEEKKRRAELKITRDSELAKYGVDTSFYQLGEMPDDVYRTLLENTEIAYNQKKEMEAKLEADRIKNELKAKKKSERIFQLLGFGAIKEAGVYKIVDEETTDFSCILNELEIEETADEIWDKKFVPEFESTVDANKKYRQKIKDENDRLKKEAQVNEKTLSDERAKAAAELAASEKKAQAKLAAANKVIRDEKEKAANALKAKMEAEAQTIKEAEEKAEAELSKGDKEKMKDFVFELENLTKKYSFKSKKYKTAYEVSNNYLQKLITNLKN